MRKRPHPPAPTFTLYNALNYLGQPDLSAWLKRDRLLSQAELWSPSTDYSVPATEASVRAAADRVLAEGVTSTVPVQLDVECYRTDLRAAAASEVDAGVGHLLDMLAWFKGEASALDVGYYSVVPHFEYWAIITSNSTALAAWHAANDYNAPLVAAVNSLYPTLYTFYNEPANWVKFANANIAEAKRIAAGKRVLPYIWPQYHNGVPLEYQYIDYDYWKLQLQTIKASGVAGAVLWGGWQTPWDETQGWWRATQDFLAGAT